MTIDEIIQEEGKISEEHMKNMTQSQRDIYSTGYTDGMRYQVRMSKCILVHYEDKYSKKVNEDKKT